MIPVFSARAANAGLDFQSAIERVLARYSYILGEEVGAFEREFAAYIGMPHCLSLANGTDALELGLRAVGVDAGDLVACVANAGFYGSTALHGIGARPLYVDIDPATMQMSPAALEQVLRQPVKAVLVTHLHGAMADIEAIAALAARAGVPLVEDCAQAHGAARGGRRAGSFGQVGCFSFYPTKNLGALGDGGAVACRDEATTARVRTLRQYGWSTKYHVDTPHGRNSRLDEVQAAVLREKLPHLDRWNGLRRDIASRYNAAFRDLPVRLPASLGEDYVAHLYVIRLEGRDALRKHLQESGIGTDVHYPVPDHRQRAYSVNPMPALPVTEAAAGEVLTLPCFPGLTDAEVATVIDAVRSFFQSR
jgi:dTDP-3-amino-2,3,6-trideoxy-4-keto-D-glucose/dTDP-3-amino-3,4,6-trideoxy-alpha-D-glucose/dTDP-2,6-dideoxy-D-kanosamine transaminase